MSKVPEALRANLTNAEFAQIVAECERLRAVNAKLVQELSDQRCEACNGRFGSPKPYDVECFCDVTRQALAAAKGDA